MINMTRAYYDTVDHLRKSRGSSPKSRVNIRRYDLTKLVNAGFYAKYRLPGFPKEAAIDLMSIVIRVKQQNSRISQTYTPQMCKLTAFNTDIKTIGLTFADNTHTVVPLDCLLKIDDIYIALNPAWVDAPNKRPHSPIITGVFKICDYTISSTGHIKKREPSVALEKDLARFNEASKLNAKAKIFGSGLDVSVYKTYNSVHGLTPDKDGTLVVPKIADTICSLPYKVYAKTSIKKVIFSDGITTVPDTAFLSCPNLQEVVLPKTIKHIGIYAFSGCTSLKQINLPDGLLSIGNSAFANSGLEEIKTPKSLKYLGPCAFNNCTKLRTVILNNGLSGIEQYTFGRCSSLEMLYIPLSANRIHPGLFNPRGFGYAGWKYSSSPICRIKVPSKLAPEIKNAVTKYCVDSDFSRVKIEEYN